MYIEKNAMKTHKITVIFKYPYEYERQWVLYDGMFQHQNQNKMK